jgi:hypothetical protein
MPVTHQRWPGWSTRPLPRPRPETGLLDHCWQVQREEQGARTSFDAPGRPGRGAVNALWSAGLGILLAAVAPGGLIRCWR